jgi:TRAP-type C4-dicarboxylate transport system permease small subunit
VSERQGGIAAQLGRWGTAVENTVLVALFVALMSLAVAQIVMRVFFSSGFIWNDELQKLIVLWITLAASIAASRSNRHLRIDLVSNFVPKRLARLPNIVVDLFAAAICALLAWHSVRYLQLSYEFGDTLLTGLDIPAWIAYSIMPFGFSVMAWRFLVASGSEFIKLLKKAPA